MSDAESNPSDLYADVRDELLDALVDIDDTAAAQIVPSCPAWRVQDVVAHVCGLNAEKLAGVPGSLGSDESTQRQVAERAAMTLGQIIDEWRSLATQISELMTANDVVATSFLADLVVHVFDLAEVLDQSTTAAEAATPLSAERYVALLQERVAEHEGVRLDIELLDGALWPAPDGDADTGATLRATSHDFLRSVTGRRTRAQVAALDWSIDPSAILDTAWNQYGSFRAE